MTLVVGILGSPRRNGNSSILLDRCLQGAREGGAETLTLVLQDLEISPCQGCNRCLTTGECVVSDGMEEVHHAIWRADAIVIASPIYFSGLTAQTKCMIDRCQCLWARESLLGRRADHPRKGCVILVAGDANPIFRNAQSELKAFFKGIGVGFLSELLIAGVDKEGEVKEREADLRRAWAMGKELA